MPEGSELSRRRFVQLGAGALAAPTVPAAVERAAGPGVCSPLDVAPSF